MKKIALSLLVIILASCAQTSSPRLSIVNKGELQFSGKGAGAGMMLSAAMGPMGIAIGFAIDEGIAKEIRAVVEREGVFIDQIMLASIKKSKRVFVKPHSVIYIDSFGFITWPGEGDAVMPQLHITVKGGAGEPLVLKFPEDFNTTLPEFTEQNAQLDDIKQEGAEIRRLFTFAANQIVKKLP